MRHRWRQPNRSEQTFVLEIAMGGPSVPYRRRGQVRKREDGRWVGSLDHWRGHLETDTRREARRLLVDAAYGENR